MSRYWAKNRLLFDILIPVLLVLLIAFAFIQPLFDGIGEANLMQSLYNNEKLDFDISSPSYAQIAQLEGEDSIDSVFPYFYTKISLSVNGRSRQTHLFFSDAFDKLDQTMYCDDRRIEYTSENFINPLLIDYQFAKETGAEIGTTVSVTFGTTTIDFQVAAIYETNTYYDGGAVLAKWEGAQKDAIMSISPKLTYSGAYVKAADHAQCKQYLESQYKPYGRLRSASEFATQQAYETHYNAFMSANYANEITDFQAKAQDVRASVEGKENAVERYTVLACAILAIVSIVANFLLWVRRSERGYFANRKMSGGSNVFVYYLLSTLFQAFVLIGGMLATTILIASKSALYIPANAVVSKSITFIIVTALTCMVVVIENVILAQKTKK